MKQQIIQIIRQPSDKKQTLGTLYVDGIELCKTLELPWINNDKKISCIPNGIYNVVRRNSDKYGDHFHLINVIKRSLILIHQGNFNFQTQGCILVGEKHIDLNNDGYKDVTNSNKTIKMLLKKLPKEFILEIR